MSYSPAQRGLSRRTFLTLAGVGAGSTLAVPAWGIDSPRPGAVVAPKLTSWDRQVIAQLRPENAMRHLVHLSESIGQRYSGTPSEVEAANYLAGVLDSYGYQVEMQPFAVPARRIGELESDALDATLSWGVGCATRGIAGGTVRGTVVLVDGPAPGTLPADLTGKIVLRVVSPGENFTGLARDAHARGAVAFIGTRADSPYPRQSQAFAPSLTADVAIPVVGVGQTQKNDLLRALAAGSVELTVRTSVHEVLTSYNVLASRPGKVGPADAERKDVMVCGHYDSVIGSKGANDDGSGTVLTVELARLFRNFPTKANVHFALWGSEEVGLVGSRHYARGLDEQARARLVGVFNNDMVGTSWVEAEKYWVLSSDGSHNVVNAAVLAAGERLGYRRVMSEVTPRGSSDHQSFQEVGVASGNFTWRDVNTPARLEPGYHSADDTIARNVSLERLTVSMEIQACAMYDLARA